MTISLSLKVCLHANWYLIKNEGASLLTQKLHAHTLFIRKSFTSFCQLLGYIFVNHCTYAPNSFQCMSGSWLAYEWAQCQTKNVFSLSMVALEVTWIVFSFFFFFPHLCVGWCYGPEGGHPWWVTLPWAWAVERRGSNGHLSSSLGGIFSDLVIKPDLGSRSSGLTHCHQTSL